MIRLLLILAVLLPTLSAQACIDPRAKSVDTRAAIKAHIDSVSFRNCLEKLVAVGIDPWETQTTLRQSDPQDPSLTLFTYKFVGKDFNGRMAYLKVNRSSVRDEFTCDDVSYRFSRGCD